MNGQEILYKIKELEEELSEIGFDIFVYNPRIEEIRKEIKTLKEQLYELNND